MKPKLQIAPPPPSELPRKRGLNPVAFDFSARPSVSEPLRLPNVTVGTGAAPLKSRPKAVHWEPRFPFDLVVTYEDEATCERAFAVCDHLVQELQNDHDVQ